MGNHRAERHGSRRSSSERLQPASQPTTRSTPKSTAGKRKAVKHSAPRGPLFTVPSTPILAGVAALAVAAGGAVTAAGSPGLDDQFRYTSSASALSGVSGTASVGDLGDRDIISRDSQRDALEDATDSKVQEQTEAQAEQRNQALESMARSAEQTAAELAKNQWVLPVDGYRLTTTFGAAKSYYSSGYHTGLDFACAYGTPIKAVANGVITEAGYDGAYGNKIVLTLEDGTELWFAHQSSFAVGVGEEVRAGDVIGYVGSTGRSYGAHLHLEVRPGGGDPVDPAGALAQNGVDV
jgi:murein DD-endopeptidase MepM/ murein hydrolase activator NlpD